MLINNDCNIYLLCIIYVYNIRVMLHDYIIIISKNTHNDIVYMYANSGTCSCT